MIKLRFKIWGMGDPRLVEVIHDGNGVFISKTLVPNILHATAESRRERLRRYVELDLSSGLQGNITYIDWNTDTLKICTEVTLQAIFRPENVRILEPYEPSRIAIPLDSLPTFPTGLRASDPFRKMEELHVIRATPSVTMGVRNLDLVWVYVSQPTHTVAEHKREFEGCCHRGCC
ncbi:uncharacterized protein K444DRAFT_606639 [Hyaloscypha bicolor E]|uniref:2EXR domain-containing protein n=1 Tax=Hyaloscypha bicolor E TaxID=1095630 RepID=A0A2J6TTL5_9HELO|nr:uncharacterized protein K444DRAFT_606639 [Hyaloscypha bicolor E]PMD66364.1 hypothetical protein K444DRAFT_606639 [Hyaloscypha bicolor E]